MKLPKELTKVTPLSKTLALILFVALPFIGFYVGITLNSNTNLVPTTVISTAPKTTLVPSTPDPTVSWKTYSNQKYGFTVKYPANLLADEENGYAYNVGFTLGRTANGSVYLHTFDIFIVPNSFNSSDTIGYDYLTADWINSLYTLKVGDTKLSTTVIFKKLPEITVAGQEAMVVEVDEKSGTGLSQQRVFLKKNGYTYMLETYYQSAQDLTDFQNFLSTFKFTD